MAQSERTVIGSPPPIGTQRAGEPIQVFFLPKGTAPLPTVDRAEGLEIFSTDGRRWIDGASGPVAVNLGYGNTRVLDALDRQARATPFANPPAFESEANRRLADMLSGIAGPGLDRVHVLSGGSEAIESALKFARQWAVVTGRSSRWKVISRMPSYHGSTLGALAISGDESALDIWRPMTASMPKVPAPFSYRIPDGHDRESWSAHCLERLEATIQAEGPETVLAFIHEPVGGVATGALLALDSYYRGVREICDRHGVLLIHDEVMCGAGRCGTFFSHHRWTDARPDISVLAKGIGAGYMPLGLMIAPTEMQEAVTGAGGFAHGHTAVGNPLACAVGLAVLEETLERKLTENAARIGAYLRSRLDGIAARSDVVGDVRGAGLLTAVEIVDDKSGKTAFAPERMAAIALCRIAFSKGLILYTRRTNGGRFGDWVMVAPPLIATEADVDEICDLLEKSLADLRDMLSRSA